MRFVLMILVLGALACGLSAQSPLPRAHSHNDYEHARPLLDALDQGFCSAEADIHLVDGQLLVAHDRPQVKAERTLQALYLDPLRDRVKINGGRVFPGGPAFTLLIDIKAEGEAAYGRLREVLDSYREILTAFRHNRTQTNAVTIILSGDRPWKRVETDADRLAALDGRSVDLDTNPSPHLVPMVSDNWRSQFRWNGVGEFPAEEKAKLHQFVTRAHQQGRQVRFWGAADIAEMWRVQLEAGVDVLNTDRLAELAMFLRSPAPVGSR